MAKNTGLKVLEFYSGIGGMHFALEAAGLDTQVEVLQAFDINTVANDVYKHNFPKVKVIQRLIESVPISKFENFEADMWTMSPPCQPFTRQGKQQHSADPRTKSFLFISEMLRSIKTPPKFIVMENVKGFDESATRDDFIAVLRSRGYSFEEYLLSPEQVGLPNSRLRYYLIAEHGERFNSKGVLYEVPGTAHLSSVTPSNTEQNDVCLKPRADRVMLSTQLKVSVPVRPIRAFLDNELELSDELQRIHEVNARTLCRLTRVMDIVTPESKRSMCFTKAYGHFAEGTGSVLQPVEVTQSQSQCIFHDHEQWAGWGERCQCPACCRIRSSADHIAKKSRTKDGMECPAALKSVSKVQKHKPPIHEANKCPLAVFKLRYFTPREISRLMGFPETFRFPDNLTVKQKRQVLGNSLNVQVVRALMVHLLSSP